ncbi:MAG: ion transporter, partial [Candidatus Cloacimonadota bacterium]
IATLTTVGYGDVYPVTIIGKILSGIIALLGFGIVALPTGIISSGFIELMEESKKEKQKENNEISSKKKYCPYCGGKLEE